MFFRGSVQTFYLHFNPFTWRCVSARSRCGAERIYNFVEQPQTGIVRVDVRFSMDLCNLFACNFNPFTWRCVSARSRCGAEMCGAHLQLSLAEQPQTGIVRVDVRFSVDPCKLFTCIFNPFTWRCVSARSRCGSVRTEVAFLEFWKGF